MKVQKQELLEQLEQKQTEINTKEALISDLRIQIEQKENRLKEVNEKLKENNQLLSVLFYLYNKKIKDISDLNTQISQKQTEIDTLNTQISEKQTQISNLNTQIRKIQEKLTKTEDLNVILKRYKNAVIESWNKPTKEFWKKINLKAENERFDYNKVFIDKSGNFNTYSSISSIDSLSHNEIEWFGWFLREYVLFDEGRFNKFLSLKQISKYVNNVFETDIIKFLNNFRSATNYKQVQDLFWELFAGYGVRVKNISWNHREKLFYLQKDYSKNMGSIMQEQHRRRYRTSSSRRGDRRSYSPRRSSCRRC